MAINAQAIDTASSIGQLIVNLVLPALGIIGGWVMTVVTPKVQAWLHIKTRNESVVGAMAILKDIVTTAVQSTYQSLEGALQANGGKLDKGVADKLRDDVLASLRRVYGPDGLSDLAKRLYATQDATLELIGHLVEQAVLLIQLAKGVPAMPPPATDPPFDPNVFGGMTQQERDAHAAAAKAAGLTPPVEEQA